MNKKQRQLMLALALMIPLAGIGGYQAGSRRAGPQTVRVVETFPAPEERPIPRPMETEVPPARVPEPAASASPEAPAGMVSGDGNAVFDIGRCPLGKQAVLIKFGVRYDGDNMYLSVTNLTGRAIFNLRPQLSKNDHKKAWDLKRLGAGETVELADPLYAPKDTSWRDPRHPSAIYRIGFAATRDGRPLQGTLGLPFVDACGGRDHPGWFIKQ